MRKLAILSIIILTSCKTDRVTVANSCTDSTLSGVAAATDATCGASDGSLTITASGGEAPYSFRLDNGTENQSGTFNNLAGGNYTIVVTDALKCDFTLEQQINNSGGVNITALKTNDAGCGSSNGSITIQAEGGTSPYTYAINGGTSTSDDTFGSLATGAYTVSVTDDNGCTATSSATITTGVSLKNNIMPIISSNCAISGCHNGSQFPNLTTSTAVINNASSIKSLTASGSMPRNGSLVQSDIDLIACWVNDGAQNN